MTYSAQTVSETLSNRTNLTLYTLLLQDTYCDRELSTLLDIPRETITEHLNHLREINLIESCEICSDCEYFQARAFPGERARETVRTEMYQEWNNLRMEARSMRIDKVCGPVKNDLPDPSENGLGR